MKSLKRFRFGVRFLLAAMLVLAVFAHWWVSLPLRTASSLVTAISTEDVETIERLTSQVSNGPSIILLADPWKLEGCTVNAGDITGMPRSRADILMGRQQFEIRFVAPDGKTNKSSHVSIERFHVAAVVVSFHQHSIIIARAD
jgi:hypothetical protein